MGESSAPYSEPDALVAAQHPAVALAARLNKPSLTTAGKCRRKPMASETHYGLALALAVAR